MITGSAQTLTVQRVGDVAEMAEIGGFPLVAGGREITIAGHGYSMASNVIVVDGSSTVSLTAFNGKATPAKMTIPGRIYSAYVPTDDSDAVVVGEITISAGSSTILDGWILSAGPAGLVVDGSRTIAVPSRTAITPSITIFTIDGQIYAAYESSEPGLAVVAGVALLSGQSATLRGHTFGYGANGIVVDASRTLMTLLAHTAGMSFALFTIGSRTFTAQYVSTMPGVNIIDGTTLSAGRTMTIDSHALVGMSSGVVIDGLSTILLGAAAPSTLQVSPIAQRVSANDGSPATTLIEAPHRTADRPLSTSGSDAMVRPSTIAYRVAALFSMWTLMTWRI